ncbi:nucleoredoxin (predicted), isoform CRA_b [Rattus norvegicus]|uniref:Nucleoredoxin (Predicted), isoform CRA_b n=1 Tax=Rattus norvegicus TaxID=10116 RepID=A6HGV5_RAT|nr:nucleoredoxin (predicted), isoform CRA_b [Rattus norvegicus]
MAGAALQGEAPEEKSYLPGAPSSVARDPEAAADRGFSREGSSLLSPFLSLPPPRPLR